LKELVAYLTTGYESKAFTLDLIEALKEAGTDRLELGIPFSDPVADGPVIEKANLAALQRGFVLDDLYELSHEASKRIRTYWMGYFNTFYCKGFETFSKKASACGTSGFIIPDLPFEEAQKYAPVFTQYGLESISFVAPTDSSERIKRIVKDATGFIYLVAYTGITGSGEAKPLDTILAQIKACSKTPVFVGFGVNEQTAKERARGADGVIVGSAFVKVMMDESLTKGQKIANISKQAKNIKEMINS
jgi:tryptophan synthase alpha chain